MAHANEVRLRELYATFGAGDVAGFLAGCTDDVLFAVPGYAAISGTYRRDEFEPWIARVRELGGGMIHEDVLEVVANDEHGVVLLYHSVERDGERREYQTAHLVEFRAGKISRWTEHPGSMHEFEAAWGRA